MKTYKNLFSPVFRGGTDMFKRNRISSDPDYRVILTIYQEVLSKIRFIEEGLRRVK